MNIITNDKIAKIVNSKIVIFLRVMYSCGGSWMCFSVTWSSRNHSNLMIWCSRNISYYYQCWT